MAAKELHSSDADGVENRARAFADAPEQRLIDEWRARWWAPSPPGLKAAIEGLPIYWGSDDGVRAWVGALCGLCGSIEAHINDRCRGRVPRWMRLPKVLFGVERVVVVQSEAKDSRSFTSVADLEDELREEIKAEQLVVMRDWLRQHPNGRLVAHTPFTDLAAFVYSSFEDAPRRVRFYQGGLVLACRAEHGAGALLRIDDRRGVARKRRSNRYQDPLALIADTRVYGIEDAVSEQGNQRR